MTFSVSALAVTPDIAGQYYVRGWYFDNPSLLDDTQGATTVDRKSLSFVDQRLRFFLRLKIVDGVSFTTRMDLMEVVWGLDTNRSLTVGAPSGVNSVPDSNIQIDQTFMDFRTGIGQFRVGYFSATPYGWGTYFMDSTGTEPGLLWSKAYGKLTVQADWFVQNRRANVAAATATTVPVVTSTDVSNDLYDLGFKYKLKSGDAGLLWSFFRQAGTPGSRATSLLEVHNFQPYVRTKMGPVNLEFEGYYMTGNDSADGNPAVAGIQEQDINTFGFWLDGRYNVGPAYVGARIIHASGDDATTFDEKEGGMNQTFGYGRDKRLFGEISAIAWNLYTSGFVPLVGDVSVQQTAGASLGNILDNAWVYQVYGGYAPTKKIDLMARVHLMKADQEPRVAAGSTWQSKDYGTELDVKATYKIYDVLTYNVGAAYLWTGDYFKGTNAAAKLTNMYMLMHWLDLTF
jgi:hypothetical protein